MATPTVTRTAGEPSGANDNPLSGKKVFIPPMAYGSGRAFASSFRAIGVNADIVPPSDERTRELGARYTSGDECYPAKVTVGDFMKLLEQPGRRLRHRAGAGLRRRQLPQRVNIDFRPRGHSLVADDRVTIKRYPSGDLVGVSGGAGTRDAKNDRR